MQVLCATLAALAFHGPPLLQQRPLARQQRIATAPFVMTAAPVDAAQATPLLELLEQRKLVDFFKRAADKPSAIVDLLKEAGLAGVVAYGFAAVLFYSVAGSAGEVLYHSASGRWLDPQVLFQEDGAAGKAETLALLASFYLACKPFAPLRLGGALILTPDVKNFIAARPVVATVASAIEGAWEATIGAGFRFVTTTIKESPLARPLRRELLKTELLDLAAEADGGLAPLSPDAQARMEELMLTLLPSLSPTPEPTRSAAFSAEWECRWTNEKELNFARQNGLFGLAWTRTYQQIDVPNGVLENVLEFEEGRGKLTVGSTIAPDESEPDGTRFTFAFSECSLRWKSFEVPLPPVGKGWGELLFLDDEMRIQRDVRGDLLIATKVGPPRAR